MELYWLAVFESVTAIVVPQDGKDLLNVDIRQAMTQRWSRSGTVDVPEGQKTEDVVKGIVASCKGPEGGGIPADALLTNIVLLPGTLVPGYGE